MLASSQLDQKNREIEEIALENWRSSSFLVQVDYDLTADTDNAMLQTK